MSPLMVRMLVIFVLSFIFTTVRFLLEGRAFSNKIEKPSKFHRFFLGVQVFLTIFVGLLSLLGLVMKDTEMVIMFFVAFVIFGAILFGIRRKFKRFYEESEDSFWLDQQYAVNRVYYENITDWIPLKKRIGVLDPTQDQELYVVVNFVFHDPEILLRHLTEMTFAGKFKRPDGEHSNDPYREQEFTKHLEKNGYGYIVEEFLEENTMLRSNVSERQ